MNILRPRKGYNKGSGEQVCIYIHAQQPEAGHKCICPWDNMYEPDCYGHKILECSDWNDSEHLAKELHLLNASQLVKGMQLSNLCSQGYFVWARSDQLWQGFLGDSLGTPRDSLGIPQRFLGISFNYGYKAAHHWASERHFALTSKCKTWNQQEINGKKQALWARGACLCLAKFKCWVEIHFMCLPCDGEVLKPEQRMRN